MITSIRWHELLKALDIRLTVERTFVLNMVGLFWNTIIPTGSTGGDFLKAYYVARQTHHRTRAVMSVMVDRVVGLLALIILGGTMAALQRQIPRCRQVAIGSAAIIGLVAVAMIVFYVPMLRRLTGLEFILERLPQAEAGPQHAGDDAHLREAAVSGAGALIVSFPVHMVVITAAQLCGIAFGLHLSLFYYWMAVPVIVLAAAIPISPQGAGVMEYFAIKLLEPQGVTVAQAIALTMSIRLTQIFWNLTVSSSSSAADITRRRRANRNRWRRKTRTSRWRNSKFEIRMTGPRPSIAGGPNQIRNSNDEFASDSNFVIRV